MKKYPSYFCNRNGSTLIISLLALALLSILGSAAITTNRTDVGISGNIKVMKESFYAAELGLAEGEHIVDSISDEFALDVNEAGYYGKNTQTLDSMKWNDSDSKTVVLDDFDEIADFMAEPPRYTIEKRQFISDSLKRGQGNMLTGVQQYNITSQGTGSHARAQSVLRTVFAMRFN